MFGAFGRIVLKGEHMLGEISLIIMSMLLLVHRSFLFVSSNFSRPLSSGVLNSLNLLIMFDRSKNI